MDGLTDRTDGWIITCNTALTYHGTITTQYLTLPQVVQEMTVKNDGMQ